MKPINVYHQKNLRKARIYNSKNPYFIITCTYNNNDILIRRNIPEIMIKGIKWFIDNSMIINLGFVIMSDHLHWAFALRESYTINNIVRRYKNFTAKEIRKEINSGTKIWQKGYYDHLLRDLRDFKVKLTYMHNNPVRKGLVDKPKDYLYSTANKNYEDMINWDYVGGVSEKVVGGASGPEQITDRE